MAVERMSPSGARCLQGLSVPSRTPGYQNGAQGGLGGSALHSPTCWTRPLKGKESRGSKRVPETLMMKQYAGLSDNRRSAVLGRLCDPGEVGTEE